MATRMPVRMSIHMSIHMSVRMPIHMSIRMPVHMSIHVSCTHVYTRVHKHACAHVGAHVYMHVYTHVYTHACTHVYRNVQSTDCLEALARLASRPDDHLQCAVHATMAFACIQGSEVPTDMQRGIAQTCVQICSQPWALAALRVAYTAQYTPLSCVVTCV